MSIVERHGAGKSGTISAEGHLRAEGVQYARAAITQGDLNDAMRRDADAPRAILGDAFASIPKSFDPAKPDTISASKGQSTDRRFAGLY